MHCDFLFETALAGRAFCLCCIVSGPDPLNCLLTPASDPPGRPLLSTFNGRCPHTAAPSGCRPSSTPVRTPTSSRAAAAACPAVQGSGSTDASGSGGGSREGGRSRHLCHRRQRSDGRGASGAEHLGGASVCGGTTVGDSTCAQMTGAPTCNADTHSAQRPVACRMACVHVFPVGPAAIPSVPTRVDLPTASNLSSLIPRWQRTLGWTSRLAAARAPAACARCAQRPAAA